MNEEVNPIPPTSITRLVDLLKGELQQPGNLVEKINKHLTETPWTSEEELFGRSFSFDKMEASRVAALVEIYTLHGWTVHQPVVQGRKVNRLIFRFKSS